MKRLLMLLLLCSSVGSTVSAKRLYTNACEKLKSFPSKLGEYGGFTALINTGSADNLHADTVRKYSGRGSMVFSQSGCGVGGVNGYAMAYIDISGATGATFTRSKWTVGGFPDPHASFCAQTVAPFIVVGNASDSLQVRVDSIGRISMLLNGTNQIARTANSISATDWYIYQLKVDFRTTGASYVLRISQPAGGTTETLSDTTPANNTSVPTRWSFGIVNTNSGNVAFNLDDLAINDASGSFENSYPSDSGKVIISEPVSDSLVGNWHVDGRVTRLYAAVNWNPVNQFWCPPIDTFAINNSFNGTSGDAFLNCQSYTTLGITSSNQVLLTVGEVMTGDSTGAAAQAGAVLISSNPAQTSEVSFVYGVGTGAVPIQCWPGDAADRRWRYAYTDPVYLPALTLGTTPVLMVGKRSISTSVVSIQQAHILVEYSLIPVIGQDAQVITY